MLYSKARDGKCFVEFPGVFEDYESESELEDFIQGLYNESDLNFEYEVFAGSGNTTGDNFEKNIFCKVITCFL